MLAIAKGIANNSKSSIKTLGVRFNFITDEGIINFFNTVYG